MPGRGILRSSKKEKIPIGQYSEYIRIWAMSNRNGQHGKLKVSLRARGLIAPADGNGPVRPPARVEKNAGCGISGRRRCADRFRGIPERIRSMKRFGIMRNNFLGRNYCRRRKSRSAAGPQELKGLFKINSILHPVHRLNRRRRCGNFPLAAGSTNCNSKKEVYAHGNYRVVRGNASLCKPEKINPGVRCPSVPPMGSLARETLKNNAHTAAYGCCGRPGMEGYERKSDPAGFGN
jgi:hypothetical protein